MNIERKKPGFLIIGAMKAGTTTLYSDLGMHPDIFFPNDKEPSNLSDITINTDVGLSAYLSLYKYAPEQSLCGDASTRYSMRSKHPHSAMNAWKVLGGELKIIYIIRNPVDRLISHYKHEYFAGRITDPLDTALTKHARLIEYSLYKYQLEPWIKIFPKTNIAVVNFESYVQDRRNILNQICEFLCIPRYNASLDFSVMPILNKSENKPLAEGGFYKISKSGLYRDLLRPLLTRNMRNNLRNALLPKSNDFNVMLSSQAREQLSPILEKNMLNCSSNDYVSIQ